jgi:hypothetical protein
MAVAPGMLAPPRRIVTTRLVLIGRMILRSRRALGVLIANVGRMVSHRVAVMAHRQQETTFQIFDRDLKLDAAPQRFTTDSTGDILTEHGPSLGQNALCRA